MRQFWWFGATALVVVTLMLLVWVLLTRAFVTSARKREISLTVALSIFSLLYALVVAELFVSIFVVQSHGAGQYAFASQRWYDRYWHLNSLGYRDHEPVWSNHLLVIVGASVIAGGGIENLDDRLSGVLARKLGKTWTVATITPGLDTKKQFEALQAYPKIPDVIIVSHTPSDIIALAERRRHIEADYGIRFPPDIMRPLVEHSSLANFIYWKYFNQGAYTSYFAFIEQAYASPDIFAEHIADLEKFKDYAERSHARLYFLLWPLIGNVNAVEPINAKVSSGLKDIGLNVIDLTPRLIDRPVSDMVVNASDSHPNKAVHFEVGNLLFERIIPQASASAPIP